jgi:thiol-disulfide isomerase/thioredoxin
MNKLVLIPALALCGFLAQPLTAQEKKKDDKPVETPKEQVYKLGSTVDENLVLRDLDGKELKFKDLRGKVVLVHFWATMCPYEIVADPKFTELEKRWKDKKDVVIVAINSNSSEIGATPPTEKPGYDAVRAHLKKKGLTFPVYADHGNKVADLFQAQSTPHCFVLDRKGVIVYQGALDDDPKGDKGEATKSYARDAVEATVEGKEIKVKETKSYGCAIKRIKS